jgi:ubiquinone/menaquinone biosynthesis C-methylase UbiE
MSANAAVDFQRPVPTTKIKGAAAKWYVALTEELLGDFKALARRIATKIPADARVLEVASGPGNFAIELAKLGDYQIAGLDISAPSVETARANAAATGVQVDFRRGDAATMPFADETFDFLICRATLNAFDDSQRALEEMHRVLKPAGRALIFDRRSNASSASIQQAVNEGLDVVNGIAAKLPFSFMLLKRAYTKTELAAFIPLGGAAENRSLGNAVPPLSVAPPLLAVSMS